MIDLFISGSVKDDWHHAFDVHQESLPTAIMRIPPPSKNRQQTEDYLRSNNELK